MTVALIPSHTSYGSNFTFEAMATLYDSVQVGRGSNETEVHFIANLFWKLGLAVMGFGKGTATGPRAHYSAAKRHFLCIPKHLTQLQLFTSILQLFHITSQNLV